MEDVKVYRFDVEAANQHFEAINSWYKTDADERRIITGDSHDDYVHSEAIDRPIGGSVPKHLLIATDEVIPGTGSINDIRKAYQAKHGAHAQ